MKETMMSKTNLKFKLIFPAIFIVVFLSLINSVNASTFSVTNDSHLSAANANAVAGDIIDIRAGTYSTPIAPARSGTSGSPITYRAHSGETVTISNTYNGIDINGKSWVVIDGIKVFYSSNSWVNARNSSRCTIRNCQFYDSRGWAGIALDGATYCTIANNTARAGDCGQTSGDNTDGCPGDLAGIDSGSYNYFTGNYWGKVPHYGVTFLGNSSKNIIDGDTFENVWHSGLEFELGNADTNLVQNCIFKNMGFAPEDNPRERDRTMEMYHHPGIQLYDGGAFNIIRKNIFHRNGNGIMLDAETYRVNKNKIYNNTLSENAYGMYSYIDIEANAGTSINYLKNNSITSGVTRGIYFAISQNQYFTNNNFYGNPSSRYRGEDTAVDSTISESSSSGINGSYNSEFVNNINRVPAFTNASLLNYTLQSSSPLIDAGTFLTTITSSSGSGSTFTVSDAGYFTDGWGIIEGDTIQLQNQTATAKITSINYSTNQITVNRTLSWTNGLGIALAFSGTAPDIGAEEYGDSVTPICGDNTCNGTETCSSCSQDCGACASGNIAVQASATASSQNTTNSQTANKAIDGIKDGYPNDYTKEWATIGEKAGAWIQLNWISPETINKIILYDRPNANDQITAGTLTFSDGSSISVPILNNDGNGITLTFPAKNVTWVRLTVSSVSATSQNIGLSEMEIYSDNPGDIQAPGSPTGLSVK
jgi:parallel beta-helix repeat protein